MTTVISVRGTHGSGKSTLVRRVLGLYGEAARPVLIYGRTRPIAYRCAETETLLPCFVPGHYETPTGGCDTVSDIATIFDLVKTAADGGVLVVFEGIVAQHSASRLIELSRLHSVRVLVLSTPSEDCVAAVRDRRAARGADVMEFDPKNVLKEYKSVLSSTKRLRSEGLVVEDVDREGGFQIVLGHLRKSAALPHPGEDPAVSEMLGG